MARAIGIGGVFFKCGDRKGLGAWYAEHLGLAIDDFGSVDFDVSQLPGTAFCVWGPFDGVHYVLRSVREAVYGQPRRR